MLEVLSQKQDVACVKQEIFRACDIRGVMGSTLSPQVAYCLGLAFGTMARQRGYAQVVLGRDSRHSGRVLLEALSQGLVHSGCEAIDIGEVPTPVLYFATYALKTKTGIMITGSHNPPDYNGFKMMLGGETLAQEEIQSLYQCIQAQTFVAGQGSVKTVECIDQYIHRIARDIRLSRPLKVVVDCGNGVVGVLAERLFRAIGCQVVPLYCEVDGNFPHHHPDPGQPENLQDLIQLVLKEKADLGFAFDGDGDRLGLISNEGEIIWPDRLMMLFAEDILKRMPGSTILYDVKCSAHLAQRIRQCGGEPLMYKTGHALIKRKMREVNAPLSGEMSGHFFFQERWYGFDDACYAACRFLEIVSRTTEAVSHLFHKIPNSVNTPEMNVAIAEETKFEFIEKLQAHHAFEEANIITVDGLRVEWPEGWGLVRASNTTPCLVLRFEACDAAALSRIQARFKAAILRIAPELSLPF